MKTRRNLSSLAVSAAVATLLAACSANPVEETNNKKPTVANKSAVKVAAKVKKITPKKPTKAESLSKKKAIIALAKTKAQTAAAREKTKPAVQQIVVAKSPSRVTKVYKKTVRRTGLAEKAAAQQLARTQVNRARAKQVANSRRVVPAKKVVKPVVRLASRPAVKPKVVRANYRKPAQPRYRKAVYKKPVKRVQQQRRTVPRIDPNNSFGYALSNAAIERTKQRVRYDGSYVKIGYPWGDVPKSIGVCTDVVIRSYRRLGIDLQQEVHKDISKDFYAYPNLTKWGLEKPDPNIDHRRVYNLQAFFKRHKAELPRSRNPRDYKPGDLVTWMVGPTFPHIGVVVNRPSPADPNRLMIAHNVGAGPVIEDILFRFPMTGHYRYTQAHRKVNPALHFAKTPPPASVLRKRQKNQISYAQLLQASKYLKAPKPVVVGNQTKVAKRPNKMYLAQLGSVLSVGKSDLNSAAVQALLNK